MKQFFYKKWVKACTVILCIVSFNLMAGSFFFTLAGNAENIYNKSEETLWEEAKERICNKYSVRAALGYQDDFGQKLLENTNFRYGVIQTDHLEGLSLNDKSIYQVCTFDKNVSKDMLYIHSYSLGDSTDFIVGDSLFEPFYVANNESYSQTTEAIEKLFYTRDTEKFYCLANGTLYPVTSEIEADFEIQTCIEPLVQENGEVLYHWTDTMQAYDIPEYDENTVTYVPKQIRLQDQNWYLEDIQIVLQKEIPALGKVISDDWEHANYAEFHIENGFIVTPSENLQNTTPYYILSYVNEPLESKGNFLNQSLLAQIGNWQEQDFFVQTKFLIHTFVSLRYVAFVIFFIFGILFLLSLGILLFSAGHTASKEVTAGWMEKIPLDLFLVGVFCIFTGMALLEAYCIHISIHVAIWASVILALLAELLALLCFTDAAIRLKLGKWWKNTVCYRICNGTFRFFSRTFEKLHRAFPFIWKAWGVMAAFALLEFIGILATTYRPGAQVTLWFFEKLAIYGFLTLFLLQMKKLQQAGEQLASGDMDSQVDTRRMFWDLKEHGNNLNHIRDGIRCAVTEQLKSERFQTELITNVSHDIKTPLTSIINYVDLLEKEDIENPTVQEYLQILSRQSTRLKKLIEDLIEASKASTGSLAVAWENCDAQVMLTQTIGEFEEKLKANQIELIVQGSTEPVFISADPRHLWRIFENMMNNICKYAQPSTRAYVNIEKMEQTGQIIFRNISRYALNIDSEELMKRFVRGDSSRNTEGNGLGLSIAKSLTELMQGEFHLVIDGDLFKVILCFPIISE